MTHNYLNIKLPCNINRDLYIGQVLSNVYAPLVANIAQQYNGLLIVLVEDCNTAYQLTKEFSTFISKNQHDAIEILHFPDWETLPFDNFSPHIEIISERLGTLYKLPNVNKGILVVPIATLMCKLSPVEYIQKNVFILNKHDQIVLSSFFAKLEQSGYIRVPQVTNWGEFSVRGSIIDVFPISSNEPFRIDLLDNEVDSIKVFDVETQRSIKEISSIKILPAQEYPFDTESIKQFRINWRKEFEINSNFSEIYQEVGKGFKIPGLEYYLPLFFENTATLFDYLPENCLIMRTKNCVAAADLFFDQCKSRFEKINSEHLRPILKLNQLFLTTSEVFSFVKKFNQIICSKEPNTNVNNYNYFNLDVSELPLNLEDLLKNNTLKKVLCVESKGRKEILKNILAKKSLDLELIDLDALEDVDKIQSNSFLLVTPLVNGFIFSDKLAIICEDDFYHNKVKPSNKKRGKKIDPELSIKNLMEIGIGDLIVHIEYGIGKYLGLVQLDYGTITSEFLVIEYADKNKLYVPVTNLDYIHRYTGAADNVILHKLGTDKWEKEKNKAAKQIKDVAAQLLEVYALRSNKVGVKYFINQENYQKFLELFPFIDTADQAKATSDVISDLTINKQPMDRVICGDVGFGKTEIAMRAAYIIIENNKQVAILVPTTLLAQQHYQTFLDRFADFPVNIQLLSRFVDSKKQQEILNKISNGTCDIVIGTHKLLQKGLKFKSLGLLIIDEEHKFGVEQKEQFKKLRSEVDVLSLTATPIPRTLNMAMSGIRDLSIIATPPNHRLSIKTFIREFDTEIIKEAIMRELQRGGQVYYVHNKVEDINRTANNIQNLLPQATVKVAHGKLAKKELEHIMIDFYHRKFNVLVCTTIIENGIDLPNANTIIIDRADCFGLSQLHQLRGRVGRSHHQAYAFCFIPKKSLLTKDALKRLEALEHLDTLGIGFTLATHDLEIRGSGELLGKEQSGHINTIGFSLYMELLEQAINYLKQNNYDKDKSSISNYDLENSIKAAHVDIDLKIPALIPASYILDVHSRLMLYKQISELSTVDAIEELAANFIDRFGVLPTEVQNLFNITKIKFACLDLGIKKISSYNKGLEIEFSQINKINVDRIINLAQENPKKFKLTSNKLYYLEQDLFNNDKINCVTQLLDKIK